jgi:hypothetical protein
MKMLATIGVLTLAAWAGVASAQSDRDRSGQRRAPLAAVEDVEPAVDVGAKRVAVIDRTTMPPPPARTAQGEPPAVPSPAAPLAPTPPAVTAPQQTAAPAPRVGGNFRALDSIDLGTTSITGNQELPKVLYIVPWKKSDLGDLVGRPVNTLLDEVLAPVDPEVFERHLDYYETLYGKSAEE